MLKTNKTDINHLNTEQDNILLNYSLSETLVRLSCWSRCLQLIKKMLLSLRSVLSVDALSNNCIDRLKCPICCRFLHTHFFLHVLGVYVTVLRCWEGGRQQTVCRMEETDPRYQITSRDPEHKRDICTHQQITADQLIVCALNTVIWRHSWKMSFTLVGWWSSTQYVLQSAAKNDKTSVFWSLCWISPHIRTTISTVLLPEDFNQPHSACITIKFFFQ